MATKMSREGRGIQILQWIYSNDTPNNPPMTIGQYARKNGLTNSPYLKALLNDLVYEGLLVRERIVHMGKITDAHHCNMSFMSEAYPELYQTLTVPSGQLALL